MSDIKVSVIIPVYNAESYLRKCLDTVVNQTLREIEIICVDDGSTDSSLDILKEYQESEPRMQIITQQNLFAGTARNTGMEHASGKYLIFWDSDDYFDLTALEKLYEKSERDKADICVCGGFWYLENLDLVTPNPDFLNMKYVPKTIPFNIDTNRDYIIHFSSVTIWNKLYLRSFIEEKKIRYKETRNGNDMYFAAKAACLAESITVLPEKLIYYRKNHGNSLTQTLVKEPCAGLKTMVDLKDELIELGRYPQRSFCNVTLNLVMFCLNNCQSGEAFEMVVDYLKSGSVQFLLDYDSASGFYDSVWKRDYLDFLFEHDARDSMACLMNKNYIISHNAIGRYRAKAEEVKKLKKDLNKKNTVPEVKKDKRIKEKILNILRKFKKKITGR